MYFKRTFFAILATLCFAFHIASFAAEEHRFAQKVPSLCSVLLASDIDDVAIKSSGVYSFYDATSGKMLIKKKLLVSKKDSPLIITATDDKAITIGKKTFPCNDIIVVPNDNTSTILLEGQNYRGSLRIRSHGSRLDVVNEINIAPLLESLLSYEVEDNISSGVLEALAIIYRTNVYHIFFDTPFEGKYIDPQRLGYRGTRESLYSSAIADAVVTTHHCIVGEESPVGDIPTIRLMRPTSSPRQQTLAEEYRHDDGMPFEHCPAIPMLSHDEANNEFSIASIAEIDHDDDECDAAQILYEQLPHSILLSLEHLAADDDDVAFR
ncbi:MAG: hypothetical protein HN411_04665 [Waddliaceae bacterium]|jgi:hypothetical protein|nr:hypothetical protein [Waddliaceae bacterium]MBT3579287.1 hypothetical protein [Waddliaceae bacterium]MBT4444516.1 hypothetical protein [Waddliaceae bacterium]MBT6928444.1 hypothetical protein [Waddliaceae bacterium]MBT7264090.1 hypothetical protein [Waddliaceae bacterium]